MLRKLFHHILNTQIVVPKKDYHVNTVLSCQWCHLKRFWTAYPKYWEGKHGSPTSEVLWLKIPAQSVVLALKLHICLDEKHCHKIPIKGPDSDLTVLACWIRCISCNVISLFKLYYADFANFIFSQCSALLIQTFYIQTFRAYFQWTLWILSLQKNKIRSWKLHHF